MAIIKPFKGIRPPQDLVEQVASRPYDVLNSAEARAEAEGNEKSLYHIIKPEIDFPVGTDEHDERVYQKAAENFRMYQVKACFPKVKKIAAINAPAAECLMLTFLFGTTI